MKYPQVLKFYLLSCYVRENSFDVRQTLNFLFVDYITFMKVFNISLILISLVSKDWKMIVLVVTLLVRMRLINDHTIWHVIVVDQYGIQREKNLLVRRGIQIYLVFCGLRSSLVLDTFSRTGIGKKGEINVLIFFYHSKSRSPTGSVWYWRGSQSVFCILWRTPDYLIDLILH